MSLRLRFKYQYRSWINTLWSFRLPVWMTGRTVRSVVTGLVVVLSIGYVVEINALSTTGYEVHDLEKQQAALERDVESLTTEVASWQSMTSIQKRLSATGMVPADGVQHIQGGVDVVVARR